MSRTATGTVEWRGTPPRWWARVTGRCEDGSTARKWVDLDRLDLKNTKKDKETAKRLALKLAKTVATKKDFAGVERAAASRVTLAELEEKWFKLLDGDVHLKTGTKTAYKSCWQTNAKPTIGKLMVTGLTVPLLRAWVRELAAKLSPSSVNNNAVALTRFISDARAEGWIKLDANPMKHEDVRAMLPTVHDPDPEDIVRWKCNEVEKLVAVPMLPDDRFGLYLVALLTGLRAGELRGLTFARVVLDGPVPLVRVVQQEKLKREAGEEGGTGTPKTRSGKRDVPLHPAAVAWLTWWRDEGWSNVYGRKRADEAAVFPAVDGEPGRPRDANILRRDLTAAELPLDFVTPDGTRLPYTFHAFRRTFSGLLGDNGISPEMVGMLDGHAGKTVTERRYMGRSLEAMERAVATLTLALPERPGVVPGAPFCPPESSRESSYSKEIGEKAERNQLHPMELPQFMHL